MENDTKFVEAIIDLGALSDDISRLALSAVIYHDYVTAAPEIVELVGKVMENPDVIRLLELLAEAEKHATEPSY